MSDNQRAGSDLGKYVEISTLTYSGPVPRPHPPCTAPTPEEQFRIYREQKSQELEEREQKQKQSEKNLKDSSSDASTSNANVFSSVAVNFRSLASKVALKMERAGTEVTNVTESKMRQLERRLNTDRFMSSFPELGAMGEVLLADYACAAMHGGLRVNGHLHITDNYLCFSAQLTGVVQATSAMLKVGSSPNSDSPTGIRQIIPLTEIACIALSVALDTVDQGPPFFLQIPTPEVLPTSLQIYTTKQQLFQFLDFESVTAAAGAALSDAVKGRTIDRAYNYLDHAWRASTTVPLPGVNYAS